MANELVHGSVGTELTQAEWEGVGTHVFNSQATGDIVYASSATQLSRLAKGTDTHVLILSSGIPAWSTSTGITAVGTIATGTWQGTDVGVAYGGTGVSTLAANSVLTGNGSSAIVAETNLTFDGTDLTLADSKTLALGTGSDSQIYYDGTDTFWNLRDTGTGDLMIALAGSYPSPDPDVVHIWNGSAGSVAAPTFQDGLVIESDRATGITFLTPNNVNPSIFFGDPQSNVAGQIRYNHSTPGFEIDVEATDMIKIGASTFDFQQATEISTSTGNLTIGAATGAKVLIGDNDTILYVDGGTGGLGFGAAPHARRFIDWNGSYALNSDPFGFDIRNSLTTMSGGTEAFQVNIAGSITTYAASNVYSHLVGLQVNDPAITLGSGSSVTNASTLRIVGAATEGTNNYALWVASGRVAFDGGGTSTQVTKTGGVLSLGTSTVNGNNASGTVAVGATASIGITTYTNNNSTLTFTDAASLYIEGIPIESTNVDITNTPLALWVDAGVSRFDGAVDIQGGYANGGGAPYDGVVDAGGGGNWTTAQAGDDDLDAGDYTMLIKGGAYSTLTVSTDEAKIVVEPGATFSGAVVLSGDDVTLVLGAGCAMSGLVTLSGANCSLICENGVDLVGILLSGDKGFVDGGGWDTLSNGGTTNVGINITGDDCVVENVASQTTAGGGSNYSAVKAAGVRGVVKNVKIITGDIAGIESTSAATDLLIDGCYIADSDDQGMYIVGPRTRIIGCHLLSSGEDGILLKGTADNSLVVGCVIQDQANDPLEVETDAENCVVVGNRVDGAIDDNSGTSTVTGNDATAF